MTPASPALTEKEIRSYNEEGYLCMTGILTMDQIDRFAAAVYKEFEAHRYRPTTTRYPEANKYTLSERNLVEPDINFIVDHRGIVSVVDQLLGNPGWLSTFSVHMKTPGWTGTVGDYQGTHDSAHCDYKTYRPVGSSIHWLFVIIPLLDYTDDLGPLLVSPGSHLCSRKIDNGLPVAEIARARAQELSPFVNANLRKGQVLFMNGFTWHQAHANRSNRNRCGVYNKYVASNAPHGCGPYLFPEATAKIFQQRGSDIVAHHSDCRLATTRLLIEHENRVLLIRKSGDRWMLPGGPAEETRREEGGNGDNVIHLLCGNLAGQLKLDLPWVTYIGDYAEASELCRVYAYPATEKPEVSAAPDLEMAWLTPDEVSELAATGQSSFGYEYDALRTWKRDDQIRGIGQSSSQAGKRKKPKSQSPLVSSG